MNLILAIKAFFYALKHPEKTKKVLFSEDSKKEEQAQDVSHLTLLKLLQQSGRLVDFLQEDISSYQDSDIGAVVRKIHADCAKSLEEHVAIRPILTQDEGSVIDIPKGYDPQEIKIVGNVKGEPPYKGKIVHKGWKADRKVLPKKIHSLSNDVLCQAEVEISR